MNVELVDTPLSLAYFNDNSFREYDTNFHEISSSDIDTMQPSYRYDHPKLER